MWCHRNFFLLLMERIDIYSLDVVQAGIVCPQLSGYQGNHIVILICELHVQNHSVREGEREGRKK